MKKLIFILLAFATFASKAQIVPINTNPRTPVPGTTVKVVQDYYAWFRKSLGIPYTNSTTAVIRTTDSIGSQFQMLSNGYLSISKGLGTGTYEYTPKSYNDATYATTASNVATATALQNTRTIWGQNFNGTANVSGAFSDATTGVFSTSLQTARMGIGTAPVASVQFFNSSNITGATSAYANYTNSLVLSGVTNSAYGNRTILGTIAASFTLSNLYYNYAGQGAFGAGSSVTSQYAYHIDANMVGASNNYGFSANLPAGAANWNFFAAGAAKNYFNGTTLIGSSVDDGINKVQVSGSVKSTQYRVSALNTAPSSATDTGTLGEIRITATFIYICTATNTWVRSPLTTW